MSTRAWKILVPIVVFSALGFRSGFGEHDASDFDRTLEVSPGGVVTADIVLGGGVSFHHGSLHIRSHDKSEVRIVSESSGWGKYAINVDVEQKGNDIRLVGRVDGPLHWMFGGPSLDVRIFVPRDFTVSARIDGGPLVLEDLAGPVHAEVREADATLRRAVGDISIRLEEGSIDMEDIDGTLDVEVGSGDVRIAGVRGTLTVKATGGGRIEIDSVIGSVEIESQHHRVEVEDVTGDLMVRTRYARIDAEDIGGRVTVITEHGGIHLEEIEGEVIATSRHGSIQVEFAGTPGGQIETDSGRIEIEVPDDAAFDLDARTGRGRIQMYDRDDERRRDRKAKRRRAVRDASGEDPEQQGVELLDAPDPDEPHNGNDWSHDSNRGWTSAKLVREINGGGPTLMLRTGRGSIRIRD